MASPEPPSFQSQFHGSFRRLTVLCGFWAYGIGLSTLLFRYVASSDRFVGDLLHLIDTIVTLLACGFVSTAALFAAFRFVKLRSRIRSATHQPESEIPEQKMTTWTIAALFHLILGFFIWQVFALPAWRAAFETPQLKAISSLGMLAITWLPATLLWSLCLVLYLVTLHHQSEMRDESIS